ncbi:MAG: arginine--tRNA ligase [Flavobacteriaceae bacterium]|nr:arginine--tRNA ligase [Flavobacteriaceae bacterium]
MKAENFLRIAVTQALEEFFPGANVPVEFQATRKDFEGDITLVIFAMLKVIKGSPEAIGNQIGAHLVAHVPEVSAYNVVKGFLNISLNDSFYISAFQEITSARDFGVAAPTGRALMVEYSSPNTNKPLHLGHIRNNLLGYSVSEILKAAGHKVYKTQIINDRGIHICKSMWAWQTYGQGETPESTGLKGDKLVGNYYVKFDQVYKEQQKELLSQGRTQEQAEAEAPAILAAKEMLRQWEQGDPDVVALWKTMNQWVYDGFEQTYSKLGVDFDKNYFESDTYLLGKKDIEHGLAQGVFYQKEDGSVWCDLTDQGLDQKLVLRSDGTSVYMTQDIGTAIQRMSDYPDANGMIYTVGNEQDYHFKVLFLILSRLGYVWAQNLYHLSYGMVDLPSGKMKSREGTVVDADDLIDQMEQTAQEITENLGKIEALSKQEKTDLFKTIGLGALKYYILKVDPKKRILFNPEESVDFQGNTGPFIQYAYARIQSILRKAHQEHSSLLSEKPFENLTLTDKERALIKTLMQYPDKIQEAAAAYSPALVANFTYDLVKEFNAFYQNVSILGAEDNSLLCFRVYLADMVGQVIKSSCALLGIEVPHQM